MAATLHFSPVTLTLQPANCTFTFNHQMWLGIERPAHLVQITSTLRHRPLTEWPVALSSLVMKTNTSWGNLTDILTPSNLHITCSSAYRTQWRRANVPICPCGLQVNALLPFYYMYVCIFKIVYSMPSILTELFHLVLCHPFLHYVPLIALWGQFFFFYSV